MKTHQVKSWTNFFQAIKRGEKKHDLRYDADRDFAVGDTVILVEYDPFAGRFTGETLKTKITYMTSRATPCAFSSVVLDRDYVILSLELVT
jgi:Domain of unknown function (DUF3850)